MELTAQKWHITRAAQDELAYESHRKAAAAWKEGFYEDLVVPFRGLAADNNVRADTSAEKLAKLRPVFDLTAAGTLTAGNSTPLTDGASAVLLASEEWARRHGLPVLAYLSYGKVWAVDFVDRRRGSAHGAGVCGRRDVARMPGSALADFDYYELHEAFAAQVLATLAAWESDGVLPRRSQTARRPWAASTGHV